MAGGPRGLNDPRWAQMSAVDFGLGREAMRDHLLPLMQIKIEADRESMEQLLQDVGAHRNTHAIPLYSVRASEVLELCSPPLFFNLIRLC